jgi:ABC-type amino acid transport substrate-binding protein
MVWRQYSCRVLTALALAAPDMSATASEPLEIAYQQEDGAAQGPGDFRFAYLRLAEQIVQDSGLPVRWVALPVQRMFHMVRGGHNDICIAGSSIIPDRAGWGQFSLPFFADHSLAVIALKKRGDALRAATSFDQLAGVDRSSFLGMAGASYGSQFGDKAAALGSRLSFTPRTADQMLDMLANGRADFGILPQIYITNVLAQRLDGADFAVASYSDMWRDFKNGFLCSSSVSAAVMGRLNQAITRKMPMILQSYPDLKMAPPDGSPSGGFDKPAVSSERSGPGGSAVP